MNALEMRMKSGLVQIPKLEEVPTPQSCGNYFEIIKLLNGMGTLREAASRTGINSTRIFRIRSGTANLGLFEVEAILKASNKKLIIADAAE